MKNDCNKLINLLQNLTDSQNDLNQLVEEFSNSNNFSRRQRSEKLTQIFQARKMVLLFIGDLAERFIPTTFEVTNTIKIIDEEPWKKEIAIDFEKILFTTEEFYKTHEIKLPDDFESRALTIWRKNIEAIKKEVETYGYDHILIIPDYLPELSELHEKMTEGYADTYQTEDFSKAGSFSEVKNCASKDHKFRLVLTHNVATLKDHPLTKATIGKDVEDLTSTDVDRTFRKVNKCEELLINLSFDGQDGVRVGEDKFEDLGWLKAEGLSLDEYLIFQRQYFESTGNHIDEIGSSLLINSTIFDTIVNVNWGSGNQKLYIGNVAIEYYNDSSYGFMGCRLSKSFR